MLEAVLIALAVMLVVALGRGQRESDSASYRDRPDAGLPYREPPSGTGPSSWSEAMYQALEPIPALSFRGEDVRAELRADRSLAFKVYRRDGYRCVICGSDGTEPRNDLTV